MNENARLEMIETHLLDLSELIRLSGKADVEKRLRSLESEVAALRFAAKNLTYKVEDDY